MTSMRTMPLGIMLMMRLFLHVGVIDNYDDVDDNLDGGDVADYDHVDADGETAFVYIMCDSKQDSKSRQTASILRSHQSWENLMK